MASLLVCACSASDVMNSGDPSPSADGGPGRDTNGDGGGSTPTGPRLSEVALAATHNSYSGNIAGDRGTILEQLELGVRMFEFDFHDNDFEAQGYRIGHDNPGHEVDHSGTNPASNRLSDWLSPIAMFSAENPDHAPLVITLDAKDDLTDNEDRDSGNLGQLSVLMEAIFTSSLVRADEIVGEWPAANALRGKVVIVLTGHHGSRLLYRKSEGQNPAIAVNSSGQVVAAFDDGSGVLWSWTGIIESGVVGWQRRTRYDTGTDPAISLSEDGVIVEVHESPGSDKTLFYRVGSLGGDGVISWARENGLQFPNGDKGVDPSVQFAGGGGISVREVHHGQSSGNPFYWNGAVNVADGRVAWTRSGDDGRTSDPRFDETVSVAGSQAVVISKGELGSYGGNTLRVAVGGGEDAPIRYPQTMFVDAQPSSSSDLRDDSGVSFFTAPASNASDRAWAGEQRERGGLVRLYKFEDQNQESTPAQNYAATDHPFDSWHRDYCVLRECLDWE